MIWLLVPVVVFVATWREMYRDGIHGVLDGFLALMLSSLMALVSLLVAAGGSWGVGLLFETKYEQSSQVRLIAIRDKDSVEGSFFLGTGTVEGSQYYFFYRDRGDGTFSPGKIQADASVSVDESGDSNSATLTTYKCRFESKSAYIVASPPCSSRYTIRVPPGTIRRGFTL